MALGSRRLYGFLDNNPALEFRPTEFVNDPGTIARNRQMVAIHSALQIDLTGQATSESIGSLIYSGFGGQADFTRGALKSEGGNQSWLFLRRRKMERFQGLCRS
jgi:acyl-CoA hydrolase